VEKSAGGAHAPVRVVGRIHLRPLVGRGRSDGRSVHALVDPGDEVELPGPTLDLPDAQRHESREGEKGAERQRGEDGAGAGLGQGTLCMSCIMPGIMLWFM